MVTTKLTERQQQFVLHYVNSVMVEDWDRSPGDVVSDENGSYKGDWEKYASEMAEWHNIKFCQICEKILQTPRIKRNLRDDRWCSCSPN